MATKAGRLPRQVKYLWTAGGRPHAGACSLHQSPLVSRQQMVLHGLNQVIFACAAVLNQGLFLHPLAQPVIEKHLYALIFSLVTIKSSSQVSMYANTPAQQHPVLVLAHSTHWFPVILVLSLGLYCSNASHFGGLGIQMKKATK